MLTKLHSQFLTIANSGRSIFLLAIRLILAYGFYEPATMKWGNISSVAEWFGEMGIPFPFANAILAASTEALGVVLLTLGIGVRYISLPLMVTMVVAIVTVHWEYGFPASDNGYEIPLYFLLMLGLLVTTGAGKISGDALLEQWLSNNKEQKD